VKWRSVLVCVLVAGCSGGAAADEPFQLTLSPDIVQGLYPATQTMLLAEVVSESVEPVSLSASVTGGTVTVVPVTADPGEIVEVLVISDLETEEVPMTITLTGVRGDVEASAVRQTVVRPFEDTLEPTARDILRVFTTWLAENRPELEITPSTEFEGAAVCPLLVVSHYMFVSDDWELGLSWHIMVAPDDWSELYLRPRNELAPTVAYRLASWSTALNGGVVEITEVPAPPEIVR
jgi:hypothetical protein